MAYEYGTLETDSDDTVTSSALADNGEYDRVEFKYYADGSPRERKDQAGTTHEYVYDYIGRLTADKVTATGTGIDDAVLCIEREYDDHGRLKRITSLDAATSGTVVNEVVYTFDGWGNVSKSQQDHSTTVSGSSPDVDYAYEDGNPGGAASYVRLDYVTYPGGRAVYYNYPSSGIGAALSRLDNIADDGSGTTKYAQYTYYGVSSIIKIAHPAVSGGLNLDYGSGGAYTGLDRFGRIIEQKWQNDASSVVYDQFRYGYDRNSNRTGRQNPLSLGQRALDQYYTYDGLDRLETSSRGYLSGTYPDFTGIGSLARKEAWNLGQTGVWSGYQLDTDGDGNYTDATDLDQDRTHNKANEIYNATPGDAITEGGGQSAWVDPVYDEAGNMTAGPRAGAIADGATRLFFVYDAWGRMTQAWEDDGDGTLETGGDDTLLGAYEYDGLHRRIKKTVNEVDYDYYYSTSWQILEIRKDGDTDAFKQYVWDINYIDAPICRWRDENTDGSDIEELYYTYDANFNVTALIHPQYGYRMDRFIYDAYGNVTVLDAGWGDDADQVSDVDNEILYCGYRFDPETGLYQVRNRYLNPRFGWITRDPKDQNLPGGGYHDGMSLYEYVGSYPILFVDPMGFAAWETNTKPYKDQDAEKRKEMRQKMKACIVRKAKEALENKQKGDCADTAIKAIIECAKELGYPLQFKVWDAEKKEWKYLKYTDYDTVEDFVKDAQNQMTATTLMDNTSHQKWEDLEGGDLMLYKLEGEEHQGYTGHTMIITDRKEEEDKPTTWTTVEGHMNDDPPSEGEYTQEQFEELWDGPYEKGGRYLDWKNVLK